MTNSNFKWLCAQDLQQQFRVTSNILEADVDRAVSDAYLFDVVPRTSDAMMAAIKEVLITNPNTWNKNASYVTGNYVRLDGVYWACLVDNNDSLPATDNDDWYAIELMAHWTDKVKPYFVSCAYLRLLRWHGANITQFGISETTPENSTLASDKRRGELAADVESKIAVYLAIMNKAFGAVNGVFDDVTYTTDCGDATTPQSGPQFLSVGVNRTKSTRTWLHD